MQEMVSAFLDTTIKLLKINSFTGFLNRTEKVERRIFRKKGHKVYETLDRSSTPIRILYFQPTPLYSFSERVKQKKQQPLQQAIKVRKTI